MNDKLKQINGKTLVLNIAKFSFVSIFSAILSLTVIPIISRVFPTDEYGKINIFFSIGNMLMTFFLFGLDNAFIRFYNEPPKNMSKSQMFGLPILVGSILNILIFILIFISNPGYFSELIFGETNLIALFCLSLYVIAMIVFRILNISYRMEENSTQYNVQNILQILINRVLFVSVAIISPMYEYAIVSITVGMIMLSSYYLHKQKNSLKHFTLKRIPKSGVKELFSFAIPLMPTYLIIWLNNTTAKLYMSSLGEFSEVGVFAMAVSLANIFAIIPSGFGVYWSSFMYSYYKTQQEMIKKVHNYVLLLSIFILSIIIILQDIIYDLLGASYRYSQPYFLLIMLNPIQLLISETTGYGINLSKNTKYNMISMLFGYILNLSICYFAIPKFGALGAAFAIAVSSIVILLSKTIIGQSFYKSIDKISKSAFAIVVIIILCVGNLYYYNDMQFKFTIVIFTFLVAFFFFRDDIKELYNKAVKQIK